MASRDPKPEPEIPGSKNPSAPPNLEEIRKLIDLIIEKGVTELEIERSGLRIKIARPAAVRAGEAHIPALAEISPSAASATPSVPAAPPAPARTSAPKAPAVAPAPPAPSSPVSFVVRSPMVGTFYAAPGQGTDPYVRVGDRVAVGQVLCIIEAMKLMNEIEAEIAGEIVKCYVDNAQPVEYGEPLYDIKPSPPAKR